MSDNQVFIEWSHKILEELTALNGRVEVLTERQELLNSSIQDKLSTMEKKIEATNSTLNGADGIVLQIDRLKQLKLDQIPIRVEKLEKNEEDRIWLLRAAIITCLGCVGTTVVGIIKYFFN